MTVPFIDVVSREPATAGLRALVHTVAAVRGVQVPAETLHSVPCDATLLHVHLHGHPEVDRAEGDRSLFTGIRHDAAIHAVGGEFLTLFAILTPLGTVSLLEGIRHGEAGPCVPLSAVLDTATARSLERAVSAEATSAMTLEAFGHWLEARLSRRRRIPEAAWRVARVCCELSRAPRMRVADTASRYAVSPRQLERDMRRWFDLSPKQFALTAKFQHTLRVAAGESSLSGIAAETGFVDQADMSRTVKRFTGMTPGRLFRYPRGPVARAIRRAAPHVHVFL